MILFFISLSAEWWHKGDLISWVSTATATSAVFVLVGCLWTALDRKENWWFQASVEEANRPGTYMRPMHSPVGQQG